MKDKDINSYALEQLSDGRHLAEIAEELGLKRTTLYMRLQASDELVDAYRRAREAGHDARAERLSRMAAEEVPRTPSGAIDAAGVQQLKLRIETDKWLLARLSPKYGDKMTLAGDPDAPLSPAVDPNVLAALAQMTPEQLRALASKQIKGE